MVANPGDRLSQCCDNLSDEEYREWLAALTRKHAIETWTPFHERDAVEVLTSVARLANAARPLTRVVNPTLANPGLAGVVAGQVRQSQYAVVQVIDAMDSSGVLDALDELPEVTFGQLRRSAISEDDARLLARAGVDDAEAEITVAIYYARRRLGHIPRRSRVAPRRNSRRRLAALTLQECRPSRRALMRSRRKFSME